MSRLRPSSRQGPIDVLEAAYEVGRTREAWLRGVLDLAAEAMPPHIGLTGYFVDAAGPTIDGILTAGGARFRGEDALEALQRLPRDLLRHFLITHGQVAYTLSEAVPRVGMPKAPLEDFLGSLTPPAAVSGALKSAMLKFGVGRVARLVHRLGEASKAAQSLDEEDAWRKEVG